VKPEPPQFFEAALDHFLSAESAGPSNESDYQLGGLNVRLRIAGVELAGRIKPAISHLQASAETTPEFVIHAWEGTMPPPGWSDDGFGPGGEITGFNTDQFRTVYHIGTGSFSMIDCQRGRALFWTRDARLLPDHERSAPLRLIFSWWLESKGRLFVHAGAIANRNGAALLLGPGGAGKSTTALLCLREGWDYLADDYCAVDPAARQVFSLYNSAKISEDWLPNVPQLKSLLPISPIMHGNKHIYFLKQKVAQQLIASAPVRVLLLLDYSRQPETTITEASPAEALRAVAPSTIFQTSASGAITLQRLAELARCLPIRRLNLGSDLEQIPLKIAQCLTSLPE
jgi:hypothetical protein